MRAAISSLHTTWYCSICPLNPDLLEQRIGRLDRIGQRHTIDIHVPYLQEQRPGSVLFHWYHEGIGLFEQSCSVGYSISSI